MLHILLIWYIIGKLKKIENETKKHFSNNLIFIWIRKGHMTIVIKRCTGWLSKASKIAIEIDGIKVAKIRDKEQLTVELPHDGLNLSVSQPGGVTSNKIEGKDGEVINITSTKWMNISFFLPILIIFLTNFISNPTVRIFSLVIIVVLFIAAAFSMNHLHLEMTDSEDK